MEKEPKVEQPSVESQRTYASLRDNDATVVSILGTKKKYRIRWLKNGQIDRLSRLLIRKGETDNEDGTKDSPHARLLPYISLTGTGNSSSVTGICGGGSIMSVSTTMCSCRRFLRKVKKKFR